MRGLAKQIDEARDQLARLERAAKAATCREMGRHDWKLLGGKNAGCGEGCGCSVMVYECARCGDCDYGDNEEADEARRDCAMRHAREEEHEALIREARSRPAMPKEEDTHG